MFPAHAVPPKLAGSVEGGTPLAGAVSVMEFIPCCKTEILCVAARMRMSGLCKVEMSGFMDGWGPMEMERMALSQRERDRIPVLQEVKQGQVSQVEAAKRLKLPDRQAAPTSPSHAAR